MNTEDLPYRKLMCAVIWQAVNHALGRELCYVLNPNAPNYYQRRDELRMSAVEYLMSADFEFTAELLGIDNMIEDIRLKVTRGTIWQIPAFGVKVTDDDKQAIRQEYQSGGVTQKTVARKYNISDRYVRKLVNA